MREVSSVHTHIVETMSDVCLPKSANVRKIYFYTSDEVRAALDKGITVYQAENQNGTVRYYCFVDFDILLTAACK